MLPSINTLVELGFKLYASPGTADFCTEHGVKVSNHYHFHLSNIEESLEGQKV